MSASNPLERSVRSLRVCAHINIKRAKEQKRKGNDRMSAYYAKVAILCRRDANQLRKSGKP